MKKEILEILEEIKEIENNEQVKRDNQLPSNCYFLGKDKILCYPRTYGISKYPYNYDGRVMWVYSSGMVKVEESTFNIFLPAWEGSEPNFALFGGIKEGETYQSFPLMSIDKKENEYKRCMVYSPTAAYFFTFIQDLVYAVKLFIDCQKQICVSVNITNNGKEDKEVLLSSYYDLFMCHDVADFFETKWYKKGETHENYGIVESLEYFGGNNRPHHYGLVRRSLTNLYNAKVSQTPSRINYTGGYSIGVRSANCLTRGKFEEERNVCSFTEKTIYGDVMTFTLAKEDCARVDYVITVSGDKAYIQGLSRNALTADYMDGQYKEIKDEKKKNGIEEKISMTFDKIKNGLMPNVMNNFLANVVKQVDFCSKAKNFAGRFLGTRDIFQQVEACLMWDSEYCREKIKQCISFIGEDGRAPRQFAFPQKGSLVTEMDLRKFIDQGVWIISTVYSYLCFSGDFSILDEVCGYYDLGDSSIKNGSGKLSNERDSLLCHLIRIGDYLISNMDEETGCLRALYGDWNDALDGLGKTEKEGKDFGNGVSVMASLQLYKCLTELNAIFDKLGVYVEKKVEYLKTIETLKNGLQKNAIVQDEKGDKKILHGWGEDKSFFVGSYNDNDGESRDSSTSNSFWILSGAYEWDKAIKDTVISAYDRLDSKYGIMTFKPGFAEENTKVGRISCLPIGTAENSATYIHATLFAIWSLFEMGEGERAWEQLLKVLPITHKEISTSPFVMSNSYLHNEELEIDGQSMDDWFTGSGCVLLKVMVRGVFGVQPTLNAIEIKPSKYFPTDNARLKMTVKGKYLDINYRNTHSGKRRVFINDKENDFATLNDKTTNKILIQIVD